MQASGDPPKLLKKSAIITKLLAVAGLTAFACFPMMKVLAKFLAAAL